MNEEFYWTLTLEEEILTVVRNVDNHKPNDSASQPGTIPSRELKMCMLETELILRETIDIIVKLVFLCTLRETVRGCSHY
jgi:hypothetical protein